MKVPCGGVLREGHNLRRIPCGIPVREGSHVGWIPSSHVKGDPTWWSRRETDPVQVGSHVRWVPCEEVPRMKDPRGNPM